MATEPNIDDLLRQAKEGIRRLKGKVPNEKQIPQASPELWPGESMDLGGFTLAQLKRQLRERMA